MSKSSNQRQAERFAALDELVKQISASKTLESWNAFARTMNVPNEMLPALMTGRVELLKLVKPRAMTAAETGVVFDAMANLIETNILLQKHAEQTALMVKQWADAFKHLHGVGTRIEAFANFTTIAEWDDDADNQS